MRLNVVSSFQNFLVKVWNIVKSVKFAQLFPICGILKHQKYAIVSFLIPYVEKFNFSNPILKGPKYKHRLSKIPPSKTGKLSETRA